MSIAKNLSRFDFLTDDADDPFQTGSKKNKKKGGSGSAGDDKKKSSKKGNSNTDRKQLQSLAFGSASEGKKKNKGSTQNQQNVNLPSSPSSNPDVPGQRNGNYPGRTVMERPKGISDEQWAEWQKRDVDFMDETYATELQAALLRSKLEYETELKNKPPGKGKKKKPVAVPLTEFNAKLSVGNNSPHAMYNTVNGAFTQLSDNNQLHDPSESDEELVERYRMEARLELERERQKAIQRELIMSRQPPPSIPRHAPHSLSSPVAGVQTSPVDEKDLIINRLTDENMQLKSEVDLLKSRVKTINNYLQAAQEVKDKAKLIYDLENVTKMNIDLNEEIRQLHSQLEQEKSRAGAAMLELRKMLENRRRTTTEGSTT